MLVPSESVSGGGIMSVRLGKKLLRERLESEVEFEEDCVERKVMKNGVSSPAYGSALLSVVFPRNS